MLNIVPFAFFSVVMGFTLDLNSLSIVFCSTLLQVPLAKTYREMKIRKRTGQQLFLLDL